MPDKYSIRSVDECLTEIGQAESTIFSCLDLSSGFWQMDLKKECRPFTAFTIPGVGQFQWAVSPMGLTGCPASFSRLMEQIMRDADNIITYIDDVVVHNKTHSAHRDSLRTAIQRLVNSGLKLNLQKCIFGAKEVAYLGHMLTDKGIIPGKDKSAAVRDCPFPTTVKQVKAFTGLCNYFRNYVRGFARRAAPLYALTRQSSEWKGGKLPNDAAEAFLDLKQAITSRPVLAFPTREGRFHLYVDAAQGDEENEGGLGAVLMQEDKNKSKRVVGYASRRLDKHERNYPAFLLELASAVYGMDFFEHHLKGRSFFLYTDHKPLTNLSNIHKKTLATLRLKLQTMNPIFRYLQGGENAVADFLSRYQGMGRAAKVKTIKAGMSEDVRTAVAQITSLWHGNAVFRLDDRPERIAQLQEMDPFCREVMSEYRSKNPKREEVVHCPKIRQQVKVSNGIIFVQDKENINSPESRWRTIAPESMKREIMTEGHNSKVAGHGGELKTFERIRYSFWWPKMNQDIKNHVKRCLTCQKTSDKGLLPNAQLQPLPTPSNPNERIHIDLFGSLKTSESGNKFILVVTDALTKWAKITAIPDKEAETVARAILDKYIYVHGVPKRILSDGGLEFCNELQEALWKSLDIEHKVTTPHHPQTNAQAEVFNKTIIRYLKTALADSENSTLDWELYLGPLMFSYNTAVHKSIMTSPFRATFGYDPRVPLWQSPEDLMAHDNGVKNLKSGEALHKLRRAQWLARKVAFQNDQAAKEEAKNAYDKKHKASMPSFQEGDLVWVRTFPKPNTNQKLDTKWEEGIIMEQLSESTYRVKRPERKRKKLATLNIVHLKPRTLPKDTLQEDDKEMQVDQGDPLEEPSQVDQGDPLEKSNEREDEEDNRRLTRARAKKLGRVVNEICDTGIEEDWYFQRTKLPRSPEFARLYALLDLLHKGYEIFTPQGAIPWDMSGPGAGAGDSNPGSSGQTIAENREAVGQKKKKGFKGMLKRIAGKSGMPEMRGDLESRTTRSSFQDQAKTKRGMAGATRWAKTGMTFTSPVHDFKKSLTSSFRESKGKMTSALKKGKSTKANAEEIYATINDEIDTIFNDLHTTILDQISEIENYDDCQE